MNPQEQMNEPDRLSPSLPPSELPTDALQAPQVLTTHDTFNVCDGSERLHLKLRLSPSLEGEIGFNAGGGIRARPVHLHSKLIEDRAAIIKGSDGTTVGLVVDGVGEAYVSPESRRGYTVGGTERVLGDIPGCLLYQTLKEALQIDPSALHHEKGVRRTLEVASNRYAEFLRQEGLDHLLNGRKEEIGGCTFALAVIPPTGPIVLASAGDAIVVAATERRTDGTINQLPDTNKAFEPLKSLLIDELRASGSTEPAKEMRILFNAILKRMQRNTFTNVGQADIPIDEVESSLRSACASLTHLTSADVDRITETVLGRIPSCVQGYAFFDGNPALRDACQIRIVERTDGKAQRVILATDGAYDNQSEDHAAVWESLKNEHAAGMAGLLARNQDPAQSRGPEATVVALTLSP